MAAKSLDFVIRAQDRFTKDMERFNAKLAKMDKNVKKSQKTMSAFTGFKSIAGLLGVGAGGIGAVAIKTGIAFNVLEENALLAFETMIKGSKSGTSAIGDIGQQFSAAERAAALFQGVSQAALKQPFKMTDLLPATQKLLAFGFAAEQIPTMITEIADAASGLGGSPEMLDRIAMAFGQINTKGKVSGEEMMQLAEAGIPAWQMLAENIGMVGPQFAKMQAAIDNGSLPIEKAIQMTMKLGEQGKLTGAGAIAAMRKGLVSRFGGLGDKLAGTTAGAFSNLVDELEKLAAELNKPAFQAAADVIKGLTGSVKGLREGFVGLPPEVQTVLGYLGTLATALATGSALAVSIAFMTGTTGGLGKLVASVLSFAGPAGAFALAIGAFAGFILAWNTDFLGAKTTIDNLLKPLGAVGEFLSRHIGTNPVLISMAFVYAFSQKVWSWLFEGSAAPGNTGVSVALAWAQGLGTSLGAWFEGTGITRYVTAGLSWAQGLGTSLGAWLDGGVITRYITAGLSWASTGISTTIGGWLSAVGVDLQRGVRLDFGFSYGSYVLGMFLSSPLGTVMQRTIEIFTALTEESKALLLGQIYRTANVAIALYGDTWRMIQGWSKEGSELVATVWASFTLWGGDWEWTKKWVNGALTLGAAVWGGFTLWGGDWEWTKRWVNKAQELSGTVLGQFGLWGTAWEWVSDWINGKKVVGVHLWSTFGLIGTNWDWTKQWIDGVRAVTANLLVNFTPVGLGIQIWNWITGTKGMSSSTPFGSGNFTPTMMAAGGIVNSPTLAMIGEAGPEAVIPLSRGRGAMGAGTTVYVTNTFTNTGVVTTNDVQAWFRRMQDEGRARGVAA